MSSSSAISNATAFLQSQGRSQGANVPTMDPYDQRVLSALRNTDGIALADITKATTLTPEAAVAAIERLRASNRVEVVKFEDNGPRFLRITPAGYTMLTGLNGA
jgi:DNA-binding MarR family transcriptional regulator